MPSNNIEGDIESGIEGDSKKIFHGDESTIYAANTNPMTFTGFQEVIAATYGDRDAQRGIPATIAWLTEELGELAQAVRKGTDADREHELGDVLAWVFSLANQLNLDTSKAVDRYSNGCPKCGGIPCSC